MTDQIRKTVGVEPSPGGLRTTVIGDGVNSKAELEPPRQTILESVSPVPPVNGRETVVERPNAAAHSSPDAVQVTAHVFRSLVRPPMALLTAFDDGSTDTGETFRLRRSRTIIGRSACDIVIPHDPDISAMHAEIVRREQDGGHQWHLVDLNSTNGMFVRVNRMILRNGRELLLGGRRFLFTCQDTIGSPETADSPQSQATQKQTAVALGQIERLGARLVEQTSGRPGREFALSNSKMLIGRDAGKCDIELVDPFIDDVHAELFQDNQKRWIIKDQKSLNGVWVRTSSKLLDPGTEFLLGGQRFRFHSC